MTQRIILTLLLAANASAQLISMASSADGSVLDFSSRLALKQEPLALDGNRIYRYGETPELRVGKIEGVDINYPILSADAQTYGTYTFTPCFGSCMIANPRDRIYLTRNGVSTILYGNQLRLSRNGRFAFNSGFPSLSPAPNMRDLDTGTVHNFPTVLSRHTRNAISDAGTIITTEAGKLAGIGDPKDYEQVLLSPFGNPSQLIFKGRNVHFATITPQGKSVFLVHESSPNFYRLLEIQHESGSQSLLWEGDAQPMNIMPSQDGQRLLMQRKDHLLLWDRQTGWKSLAYLEEGFSEALLSDNGSVVFAISQRNRYLRIDANTNESIQLFAPFPSTFYQSSLGAYPGSLLRFVVNSSAPNLNIKIGSTLLPTIRSSSPFLDVQIPWEATELIGQQAIAELTTPDFPFALRTPVQFSGGIEPWAFTYSPVNPFPKFSEVHWIAAREDFSSLLSPEAPAAPGSVIHLWVSGLGPLNQPLSTGTPGPINPLARPLSALTCTVAEVNAGSPRQNLRVLDVTYAPNLIGIYQVDLRIPEDWSSTRADIRCTAGVANPTGALVPVRPI